MYLFTNEAEYTQYLNATYPGLPKRRAYFVGTPRELAVYTYWGERIQEDLRHEYTHGLLHACLKQSPYGWMKGWPSILKSSVPNRARSMWTTPKT